ncbi:MAG: hypothetical protein IE917_16750, partial [Betaproteobacteria bacterium]|nr:hypothetical protein [Betaproteobacteria bacterium]
MAEASANSPEIQRLSAVEREILRCVAIGEVADFTGKKWSRSRKVDGRPVVAAKFLADLWLGMHSVRVHPFGINIKGLHVGGAVELGGARVDARMRTPLIGFVAIDCRFTGRFGIDNAKVETVAFYDCVFDSPQQGRACVSAGSAEIIGQFGMSGCKLGGTLVLRNAVIDDDLGIYDTTVEAGIWAEGAEIRGNATFRTARIANSANAISLYDAIVAGKVEISHCVLEGGLVVIQLSAGAVTLSHTSLSGPFGRLAANFASVAHSLHITHCRLEKGATLAGCKIGGQIFINRSRIGSAAPDPWALTVSSATVAISVMIQSCRINGGIRAYDLDSGEHLRLQHISCRLPGSNLIGLDLTRCTVASLDFQNCFIGGQTKLDHAKLGRADIYDCTIDMRGRRGRMVLGDDVVVRFPGLTLYGAVIDRDLVINGSSAQSGCAIDGGLSVVSMHCGGHMVVRQCWLGKEGLENSLNAWDLKAALIEIDRCMLPSGLDASDLQTADMRLKSSVCCAPTSGPSEYIAANLMGARIGRSCTIGNDPGEGKSLLQLIGSLVLADGEVGNTLWLQGLVQSQPALHA